MDIALFRSLIGKQVDLPVCLESVSADKSSFTQVMLPFDLFLEYLNLNEAPPEAPSLYLAQEPLLQSFPQLSGYLLPVPDYVKRAGKGDIYATNLWIGRAGETNTPLHKDPNPNLFVQLAGRKRVRILSPEFGRGLVEHHRGNGVARRFQAGDEMMVGKYKEDLDVAVWSEDVANGKIEYVDAEVGAGDGLFIPRGWWHAVKGVGNGGVSASVSWFGATPL